MTTSAPAGEHLTPIVECDVPATSVLDRRLVSQAWFTDAYRAPMNRPDATVIDLFFAVFGHHPRWIKRVLIVRNHLARACGLQAPTAAEILDTPRHAHYKVGDKIGPWPIFVLSPDELVAGRDNKHLDFRLSVLREPGRSPASAVVSTVCTVHNLYGKVYLFFIVPFHRWGVKLLMKRAVAAGRL